MKPEIFFSRQRAADVATGSFGLALKDALLTPTNGRLSQRGEATEGEEGFKDVLREVSTGFKGVLGV